MVEYEACRLATTRRWHIYDVNEEHSVCGMANSDVTQVLELGTGNLAADIVVDWPSDDLNYCERCAQVMISRHKLFPRTINKNPPSVVRKIHKIKHQMRKAS